jgi:hypothetical protein
MYNQWLSSPSLESEDVFCKLLLIKNWCETHQIELTVLQAYSIPWNIEQLSQLTNLIVDIENPLYSQYKKSLYYVQHDFSNQNTVPCIEYQIELAKTVSGWVDPIFLPRIEKIQKHYTT